MSMGTSLRSYVRGHSLVSMREGATGAKRYFHFDHQGTTQALTDSTGAVTDRFASDAWGVQVKRTGNSINRQWYVANTGYYRNGDHSTLDYVRARWLSPGFSRWLSIDPSRKDWAYAYADNRPIIWIDAGGLRPEDFLGNCASKPGWEPFAAALSRVCATLTALLSSPQQRELINQCIAKSGWCRQCQLDEGDLGGPGGRNFKCFQSFCEKGRYSCVECCSDCARAVGSGKTRCHVTICWSGIVAGNCHGILGMDFPTRLWLHELLHCCGFEADSTDDYPSCNDVVACCVANVVAGTPTNSCYVDPETRKKAPNCGPNMKR